MQVMTVNSGVFRLGPGSLVGLTARQARDRSHNLKARADVPVAADPRVKAEDKWAVYEARAPLDFRAGECLIVETTNLTRVQREAFRDTDLAATVAAAPAPAEKKRKASEKAAIEATGQP